VNTTLPIDLRFRPESYWTVPETVLANINGEARRRAVRDAIERGTVDSLPAPLLADDLPAPLLRLVLSMHPRHWGGETLPDYLPGEVEIARAVLPNTVLGDVISFRARRAGRGIAFRVVDDNGFEIEPGQRMARRPLTMSRLVRLIERSGEGVSLWASQLGPDDDPNDATSIFVSSVFYPELERYYSERASRWLRRRCGQWAEPVTAERLDVIRRGLLWRLDAEDRQRGIARPDWERHAAVERFIRLRFMVL
jgi:hypothetical protein